MRLMVAAMLVAGTAAFGGADFSAFDTEEIKFAFDTVFIVRKTADKPLELISIILSEDCPMDYGMDGDECEKTDCFHCWMKEVDDDE